MALLFSLLGSPETKVLALFRGHLNPRSPVLPANASCSLVNYRAGWRPRAGGRNWEGTREAKGGKRQGESGAQESKSRKGKIKVVEERNERRDLRRGGGGECGCSTGPGSEGAFSPHKIKWNNNKKNRIASGGTFLEPEIHRWATTNNILGEID